VSKRSHLGSVIEKKATKWAEDQGWWSYKVASSNKNGIPDRVYLRDGKWVLVEFKGPVEVVSGPQERRIGEIVTHGGIAWVCRDLGTFMQRMR
jgi:hypothetical protein